MNVRCESPRDISAGGNVFSVTLKKKLTHNCEAQNLITTTVKHKQSRYRKLKFLTDDL